MAEEFSFRGLLKSSFLYGLSDILLKLIGIFLVPIYTAVMMPEQYGLAAYASAVSQVMMPLIGLGIVNCLPMIFFSYEGKDRQRLVSTAINVVIGVGVLTCVALTFFAEQLFTFIAPNVPFTPHIVIAIWTALFAGFNLMPLSIFNIQSQPIYYMAFSVGLALLNVISAILFVVVMKLESLGILYGLMISAGSGFFVALFVFRNIYQPIVDKKILTILMALSLPILPHLISGALARYMDRILLAKLSTLEMIGIYSLAQTLVSPVTVVMGAAFAALGPMFYKRAASLDPTLASDWSKRGTQFFLVGAIVVLGLSIFSKELVSLIARNDYADASQLIPLMAVSQLILGLYWFVTPAIGHLRKTWIYPIVSITTLAVSLVFNLLLIPVYGALGAIFASLISSIVQFALFFFYSQRCLYVRYEYREIGMIFAICFIAIVGYHWCLPQSEKNWIGISVKLAIFMSASIATLIVVLPASSYLVAVNRAIERFKFRE